MKDKHLPEAEREGSGLANFRRARAYEDGVYNWSIRTIPAELEITDEDGRSRSIPHPARQNAVFVVHGIGQQEWTETAATLHSGFEGALEKILKWQLSHGKESKAELISEGTCLRPPFELREPGA